MNKTAVITGADGGMGTEITKAVALARYHVICFATLNFWAKKEEASSFSVPGTKI